MAFTAQPNLQQLIDLVAVANAFGKDAPGVNGDGTINVLDLVTVANVFQ